MVIILVSPHFTNSGLIGNRITALRYAKILQGLGHQVGILDKYTSEDCQLLIALHARRSFESIKRFKEIHPTRPLIVVLTGTDIYQDIRIDSDAKEAIDLAGKLVVLQPRGLDELPVHLHPKTRVIYQSAEGSQQPARGTITPRSYFKVCVVGHMREVKDPFRAALAVRSLPEPSRVRLTQVGNALTDDMKKRAEIEGRENPRYRWMGELSFEKTQRVIANSHLLVVTSSIEGGSNALSEALAYSVPVLASRISGLVGTLGEEYPGYFEVGDTEMLARLLRRAEVDREFYGRLKSCCAQAARLVSPALERTSWAQLLGEVANGEFTGRSLSNGTLVSSPPL